MMIKKIDIHVYTYIWKVYLYTDWQKFSDDRKINVDWKTSVFRTFQKKMLIYFKPFSIRKKEALYSKYSVQFVISFTNFTIVHRVATNYYLNMQLK